MFKRKTIRKIVFTLVLVPAGLIAFAWVYNNFFAKIDTSEINRYYDLLSKHAGQSKYIVLNLGVKEGEDLQVVSDRLKDVMGLKEYEVWIGHHDDPTKPPAFIKDMGYHIMGISMYSGIREKREETNLLTHELGHIYVWNFKESFSLELGDEEKIVDTSGMFLGLGILVLNGLTDDFFYIPGGGEYTATKRFYGYLTPGEFGYLLARYSAEHGVPEANVMIFLNSTGRKYFDIGRKYLAREKGGKLKPAGAAGGLYWCQECGKKVEISVSERIKSLKCPRCGHVQ